MPHPKVIRHGNESIEYLRFFLYFMFCCINFIDQFFAILSKVGEQFNHVFCQKWIIKGVLSGAVKG